MPKLKERLEELETLKVQLREQKKVISLLQNQVDDASEYEDIAERLTHDNSQKEIRIEKLGEEIMHLVECKTIAEAESLETYEYINELEGEISEKDRDIQERTTMLEDKDKTIAGLRKSVYQFRQLVRKLQDEGNQLWT